MCESYMGLQMINSTYNYLSEEIPRQQSFDEIRGVGLLSQQHTDLGATGTQFSHLGEGGYWDRGYWDATL